MHWMQVSLEVGGLDTAPLVRSLEQLGALSIEYRDAGDQPIFEPAPGDTPLWQRLRIVALLPADTGEDRVRQALADAAAPGAGPKLRFARLAERDWVAEFNRGLRPRRLADGLWICPCGSDCPDPAARVIRLQPGLAFGSGEHPSTAMCIEWLAARQAAGQVLDYGCGSGILSLAAAVLGAAHVDAVDIDPQAIAATRANVNANALAARIATWTPDELPAARRYELIVANIFSGVLIQLAGELIGRARAGACFALGGILTGQAEAVRRAYAPRVRLQVAAEQDGWALLTGQARN